MITLLIHNSQFIIMITGVAMIYLNAQANTSTCELINL